MTTLQRTLAATLLGALGLPVAAPALAQQPTSGIGGRQESDRIPDKFTIQPYIERINGSMRDFATLGDSLGQASKELQSDFDAYLGDPTSEVLASRLEKKMAIFADQVIQDFDRIVADQDLIISNFKELRVQLQRFDGAIEEKLGTYDLRLEQMRQDVAANEQTLIGLAVQIKEAGDEAQRKQLKQAFAREYRRQRLKDRYVRGLERNLHNYQVLVQNLQMMTNLFTQLQDKFIALIENLENERQYLLDAIELQQDSVKIKKIMHDGILHGERSIKAVTEQLAKLYVQVDAFTQVHDKINMGLSGYGQTQDTLKGLSERIDQIVPLVSEGDPLGIEAALEHYFDKRSELKPENRGKDWSGGAGGGK
jgi:DNA repair exonuclease SbcCD ATPase subunit